MTYAQLKAQFSEHPIIPVLVMNYDVATAVEIAKALQSGGISQVEILVRGDEAQQNLANDAIRAIRENEGTREVLVGAGTVNAPEKMHKVVEAGAQFLVSPDSSKLMLKYWKANHTDIPFYPTVMTTTEIQTALDVGIQGVKIFPKNQILQPDAYFLSLWNIYGTKCHCVLSYDATHPKNLLDIKYPFVAGFAATWLMPAWAITEKRWDVITQLAGLGREAVTLERAKNFPELHRKIKEICVLARVEAATQEAACQTDTPAALLTRLGIAAAASGTAIDRQVISLRPGSA